MNVITGPISWEYYKDLRGRQYMVHSKYPVYMLAVVIIKDAQKSTMTSFCLCRRNITKCTLGQTWVWMLTFALICRTLDKSLDLSEWQLYTSAKQGSQYLQGALLGFLKLVVCVKHVALCPASGSFPENSSFCYHCCHFCLVFKHRLGITHGWETRLRFEGQHFLPPN